MRRGRASESTAAKCNWLSNPVDASCKFLYCSEEKYRIERHLTVDVDLQFAPWTKPMNTQFTIALNLVFSSLDMPSRNPGRPLAVLGATAGCR
jgi:hypothetical protein